MVDVGGSVFSGQKMEQCHILREGYYKHKLIDKLRWNTYLPIMTISSSDSE